MNFASPIPLWLAAIVAAAIAAIAVYAYRRPPVPLSPAQRGLLIALRALSLSAIVVFLCRPVAFLPPAASRDIVVPVLVDVSRSMNIADADGQSRIDRARTVLQRDLLPSLSRQFTPDLFAVGDGIVPAAVNRLAADARHSNLSSALAAIRDRYRGRRVAGVILLSDGGETAAQEDIGDDSGGIPVYAIGIGSPAGVSDREVLGMTAGEPRVDQDSVDLHVTTVSRGYGRTPFDLHLLGNGRLIDSRRIVPSADGSPSEESFTVSPDAATPTVYTAQIDPAPAEAVVENNARAVLVGPPGRKRRIFGLQGAPGFEHSFLMRALAHDSGLEVDSVVRKGANDNGRPTFFVQAGDGRGPSLASGFPPTRDALFAYDGLVVANLEGDFFSRAQLQWAADFVSERGGGLLVLGGRSFAERGLIGTPLEQALPVELSDRRAAAARTGADEAVGAHNSLSLTPAGDTHPIMRLGGTTEETRRRWAAMPALSAVAMLGGPRPGATVLAVTSAGGGAVHPVVAVQRYGRGRSMIGGEASWRWRMLMPAADRTYDVFWRQAVRWAAGAAPDQVTITVPESPEPGDAEGIAVDVRDPSFQPIDDATVEATLTSPGGDTSPLTFRHGIVRGRLDAPVQPDRPGLYKVHLEALRGSTRLGAADRWFYAGGSSREFVDPRLNEAFLRRVARASGGRYVRAAEAARIVDSLKEIEPRNAAPERRDVWHQWWAFSLLVLFLGAEWLFRRRWGLR